MRLALALVPLALVAALPAKATTTIENWTFQASTPTGPITSHSGSFSFSYDQDEPFNPTLISVDSRIGDLIFDASNTGIEPFEDSFAIGGISRGIRPLRLPLNGPTADWLFYVIPTETYFGYVVSTSTFVFPDRAVRFTREILTAPVGNPVPEPATWAMLIAGFGLIGAAQRKRRARQPATS
ncbi:MAG: PEPxxWA-CTERM sorting domain-containing protein [Polymorphobacter sp.]|uniref:PEPxxWA-CTERM sorting domain-containing protein n=1 Tax=Polymorphobacter sp. TaxID=1909290 RepID=UPI003A88C322